jgi:hypothetical protein
VKRITLTAVLIILVLSACSARSRDQVRTSKGAPAPGQDVFPLIASSEIVVGDNRLQIGLIDTNDAPVRSPKTALQVAFVGPDVQEPSFVATIRSCGPSNRCKAYGSEKPTFDRPGEWEAVIKVRAAAQPAVAPRAMGTRESPVAAE